MSRCQTALYFVSWLLYYQVTHLRFFCQGSGLTLLPPCYADVSVPLSETDRLRLCIWWFRQALSQRFYVSNGFQLWWIATGWVPEVKFLCYSSDNNEAKQFLNHLGSSRLRLWLMMIKEINQRANAICAATVVTMNTTYYSIFKKHPHLCLMVFNTIFPHVTSFVILGLSRISTPFFLVSLHFFQQKKGHFVSSHRMSLHFLVF